MEAPALHQVLQKLGDKGKTVSVCHGMGSNTSLQRCAATVLVVGRGQVVPGGWKMDVGQGRTGPRGFFKAEEDPIPYPSQLVLEGGDPQLLRTRCKLSVVHGLGHRSSRKSSQGKQVVRTSLGQHKAWK